MTITSATNRVSFAGDGSTTVFSFAFPITVGSDLKVVLRDASGNETLQVIATNYTVSAAPYTSGGAVTMLAAPAVGITLFIIGNLPVTQPLNLQDGGPLPAGSANGAWDRAVMLIRQLTEKIGRALVLRDTDTYGSGKLYAGGNEITGIAYGTASDSAAAVGQIGTNLAISTTPQAVAGTNDATVMSPLKVAQALLTGTFFTQSGTGASSRTFLAKMREIVSILDFGGVGDGTTDNATALANALASLGSAGGRIYFPAGKFKFSSAVTFNMAANSSISIIGAGQDNTILYWPSGNGLTLNYQDQQSSTHFQDLSFTTNAITANTALKLIQVGTVLGGANMAQTDFFRVTFRGDDGYMVTKYWTTALQMRGISTVNLNSVFFTGASTANGNGIDYAGLAGSGIYAVVLNVNNCVFNNLLSGLIYGSYVQGVTVNQSNFTGCTNGITAAAAETGSLSQLAVTNSQFGQFAAGNSISTGTTVNQVLIANNTFITTTGAFASSAIFLSLASDYSIVGNAFTGSGGASSFGIIIGTQTASTGGVIAGNFIGGYGTGILLQAGSTLANIQGNQFIANSATITNSGTGTNVIANNQGHNPVGVTAAATMGASPFTYTAGYSPETHYVKQSATNTATIAKGGQQIIALVNASTYYTIQLGPNESYVTTWTTTAPTYTKDVH